MKALDRRTVLRGLGWGAATLPLPPLEAMLNNHGIAYADGTSFPVRFGVWWWGSGVVVNRWVPTATGENWPLSSELMPLGKVKNNVTIVSGTDIPMGAAHASGTTLLLSGDQPKQISGESNTTFPLPSIDVLAARVLGNDTKFRSLNVAVDELKYSKEGTTGVAASHNGPSNPNLPEYSPQALFDRLFPNGVPSSTGAPPPAPSPVTGPPIKDVARKSILDAITADFQTLRPRVSTADRARLDQHLDSVRAVERRIQAMPPASTTRTTTPVTLPALTRPPAYATVQNKRDHVAVNQVMSDLIALALATDQTRVFAFQFGMWMMQPFWQAGLTDNFHEITHLKGADETVHKGVVFMMTRLAEFLERLQAIQIGSGTLLDQCAIFCSSDQSEGHLWRDMPIVVAGKAGGKLRAGIHYRADHANSAKVVVSVLRAAGVPLPEWGVAGMRTTEGLKDIEI